MFWVATFLSTFGVPVMADNVAKLHAVYQSEPFDWCPKGTPVAILLTVDGPDVTFGQSHSRKIIVRRGSQSVRQNITRRDTVKTDGPTGRFEGSFELCGSIWERFFARGTWVVRDESGEELASMQVQDQALWTASYGVKGLPFFRLGSPPYLEFDEQRIAVIEPFEIERTLSIGDTP